MVSRAERDGLIATARALVSGRGEPPRVAG